MPAFIKFMRSDSIILTKWATFRFGIQKRHSAFHLIPHHPYRSLRTSKNILGIGEHEILYPISYNAMTAI